VCGHAARGGRPHGAVRRDAVRETRNQRERLQPTQVPGLEGGVPGRIPAGAIVLLRTGFGKFYPDRKKYLGTDERGAAAVAKLHFPGLDPQAARWLGQSRSIKAIGLDTASIDRGQSTLFESHRNLFERNIPAFENVANLDQLPVKGFTVVALPMKIKGGSGGPLRIIAML